MARATKCNACGKKNCTCKKNPPRMKNGTWIKADKVRLVQRNGRKVLEIRRTVKRKRRKR